MAGEWTTAAGSNNHNIVAGLSATGQAYAMATTTTLTKTLAANYARLIGGVRFASTLGSQTTFLQFRDGATAQCTITLETTGIINLRTGTTTILGGGATISANTTHYLEWDITFGASAAYQVWLDGVSLFSGTGNTRGGTANNYANAIAAQSGAAGTCTYDDLYLFDSTGSTNNAVLLTSPRIETTFPTSDSAVQFAVGAGILGSSVARVTTAGAAGSASALILRKFTPAVAGTLASITTVSNVTNGTVNLRPAVYADSAGTAGSLLSSGSTVTGVTVATPVTLPLTTPQSLSAGTQYWLGVMLDTNINMQLSDGLSAGYARTGLTFGSGAPNPAGTIAAAGSYFIWGNLTGVAVNYDEVNNQPPDGQYSYVFDATVNHEDLYTFGALSVTPLSVYAVVVKGYIQRSDAGAKTVSLRTKSGASDSGGSLTGQTPAATYGWLTSVFETDPGTGAAWTGPNLNAATSGVKVDS
jgi:hypothetical protein